MAGTKAGALKAAARNRELHGEDFYSRIGAAGGRVQVPKGFAKMDIELVRQAGIKGGKISKRGKQQPNQE